MPYISIESGKLTAKQKKTADRTTYGHSRRDYTYPGAEFFTVTIKELPDENFGIGGKSVNEIKRNPQG